uniref:diablo IAP-binding mitochondrial protein n=1 Tax=Myxine glutinosa TaxID=7769 RepID=UPI00358E5C3A
MAWTAMATSVLRFPWMGRDGAHRMSAFLRIQRCRSAFLQHRFKPLLSWSNARHAMGRLGRTLALSGSMAWCAVPVLPEFNTPDLSQSTMIKRAAALAIDAASTLLTQAGLAFMDAQQDYAKAISMLLSLYKRYTELSSRLSAAEDEAVRRLILEARTELVEKKQTCDSRAMVWAAAEKLVEAASEAAFQAGAEQASLLARTHLDAVHSHVESSVREVTEAQSMLAKVQATEIRYAGVSAEQPVKVILEEEEQLPEQYLRED